jgi:TolB-like protein/Flp pilus assembly protein TadD
MTGCELTPEGTPVPPEAAESALRKLLASPQLSHSRRLSELLEFISRKALAGQGVEVTEAQIARAIYGRDPDYDPTVDPIVRVEANRLRGKLQAYYAGEGRDESVRLRLPPDSFVPLFEAAPVSAQDPAPADGRRRSWRIALAAGLAAVTTMAALVPFGRKAHDPRASIAVLPFANGGGLQGKDYFSEGLTERITGQLGRTGKLQVAAERSAREFKNHTADIREIGRRLQVDLVLEGSVRFGGDRIGIEAQLYDTHNGRKVWSGAFDRLAVEASSLQEDVSQGIERALQVSSKGPGGTRQAMGWTNNSAALDLYLQAQYLFNSRKPENLSKSVELYNAAVRKDPEFALAYAGLAQDYVVMGANEDRDIAETTVLARQAVARALAIDPNLPEALLTRAATADHPDFAATERDYRAAIAANPSNTSAHHWLGLNLMAAGRFAEAQGEIRQAQLLDPLSLHIGADLGAVYYFSRQYGDAIEHEQKILKLDPHLPAARRILAQSYEARAQYAEAQSIFEKLAGGGNCASAMADLGHLYAVSGQVDRARQTLQTLTSMARTQYVAPHQIALIHAGLGHKAEVLALLEMSYEQHDAPLAFLKVDPRWDSVRGDPRFRQLLHALSLDN